MNSSDQQQDPKIIGAQKKSEVAGSDRPIGPDVGVPQAGQPKTGIPGSNIPSGQNRGSGSETAPQNRPSRSKRSKGSRSPQGNQQQSGSSSSNQSSANQGKDNQQKNAPGQAQPGQAGQKQNQPTKKGQPQGKTAQGPGQPGARGQQTPGQPQGQQPNMPQRGGKGSMPAQDLSKNKPINLGSMPKKPEAQGESPKDKLKNAAEDQAKSAAKKIAAKLARQAAMAVVRAAAQLVAMLAAWIGWPAFIIIAVMFIGVLIYFGGLGCSASDGEFGKTRPQQIKTDNPAVQAVLTANSTQSRGDYKKVDFLNARDKEAIEKAQADKRLTELIQYLSQKHERIQIDHIFSGYENMPNNPESGQDSNQKVVANISAHKDGLAADIGEIDFVFRVFEENAECSSGSGGQAGDIVYYNDRKQELLRLVCEGNLTTEQATANTNYEGNPVAKAIPISVRWQDDKPDDIKWLQNVEDPSTTTDPRIFDNVYRPEAQFKVHQVITQLLQFPYDKNSKDLSLYRVTQIETFSQGRDVQPFIDNGTLDKLYGSNRQSNVGLFSMKESWAGIHIGY